MSRQHVRTLADDLEDWFSGEDRAWADAVTLRLLLGGVSEMRTREALLEAHDLIATSGESASDLFGAPAEYVDEHLSRWREIGLPYREAEDVPLTALVAVQGAIVAVGLSVLVGVPALLRGEAVTWSPALLLAPVLLSVLLAAVIGIHRVAATRHSRRLGVVAGVVVTAVGAGAAANIFLRFGSGPSASAWWMALYLVVHLLAAGLVLVIAPARDGARPSTGGALEDDAWTSQVAARLRTEVGFSDARAADVVAEARAHADRAGVSLVEEFGVPASFVARHTPDVAASKRREAVLYAVAAVLALVVVVTGLNDGSGVSWWALSFAALLAFVAATTWRAARREAVSSGSVG